VAQARPDRDLERPPGRGEHVLRGRHQGARRGRDRKIDEAVRFADESPFPDLDSLYDDIYVLEGDRARAWWTVDERSPEVHRGEEEREAGELPHELAERGAAYASVGDQKARARRDEDERSKESGAEGEQSGGEPEEEGGAD
jgi:hypothetical protein